MTDQELAVSLVQVTRLEGLARAHWTETDDLDERALAIGVVRRVTDTKRSLEQWIAARACRAVTHGIGIGGYDDGDGQTRQL